MMVKFQSLEIHKMYANRKNLDSAATILTATMNNISDLTAKYTRQ